MGTEGKFSFQLSAVVTLTHSFEKYTCFYHMEQNKSNLDFSIYMELLKDATCGLTMWVFKC